MIILLIAFDTNHLLPTEHHKEYTCFVSAPVPLLTSLILPTIIMAGGWAEPNGQTIQSARYSTAGYIKPDGTIQNNHYATIGYIKTDGTIQNSSYQTIGYIKPDGTIQNRNYSTLGTVKENGTVQNSNYQTLGK